MSGVSKHDISREAEESSRLELAREPVFPHTEVGTNRGPSSGSATDDVLRAFPGFALVIGVVAAVCRALVTMAAQRRD